MFWSQQTNMVLSILGLGLVCHKYISCDYTCKKNSFHRLNQSKNVSNMYSRSFAFLLFIVICIIGCNFPL